jgi:acyl-CoA thioesterase
MSPHPHPSDVDLLGLELADDGQSGRFELRSGLVRHDGALYGGTGLAVSIAAMEAATGRDVLWASTQFVGQPYLGTTVEWSVERLAVGKRAAQLLVRATTADGVAFVAIGSTGIPAEDGLTGQYVQMPKVGAPDSAPPRVSSLPMTPNPDSWTMLAELREAQVLEDDGPTVAFWARLRGGGVFTPAAIAFVADMVPLSVARAAGKMGAGSSLDNSMRFRGGAADAPWVLLDLHGDFANGGFGHGTVRMWSEDGVLLATGSQSASMRYLFEPGESPNLPPPPPAR